MRQIEDKIRRQLNALRPHVLRSADAVCELGWQDMAEAVADLDVTVAALQLRRPEALGRAEVLLAEDGPLCELAELAGWRAVFDATMQRGESAIAA